MPNLDAGTLRHYITINAQSTSPDAFGEPQHTWTALLLCWSCITAVTSKDLYTLGGFTSQVTHKVVLRYPAVTIKAGMQVLYGTRTFTVQAVSDPDETRKELDLFCLEVS